MREDKVKEFFEKTRFTARWCNAKGGCACMGCVNNYPKKKEWYAMFPDEPYLTEQDVKMFNISQL